MPKVTVKEGTPAVPVTSSAASLTQQQRQGHLPRGLRPPATQVSLGHENTMMDVDEYCYRVHNNWKELFPDSRGNGYAILFAFGKHVFQLLGEKPCPNLTRERWDGLFEKYRTADGSVDNVVLDDLEVKAKVKTRGKAKDTDGPDSKSDAKNEE